MLKIYQKIITFPYQADEDQLYLLDNPIFNSKTHKLFRTIVLISLMYHFLYTVFTLIWLFFHWKSYTFFHMEEAVIHSTVFLSVLLISDAYHPICTHSFQFRYMINQILLISKQKPRTKKYPSPAELFPYALALLCFTVPLGMFGIPFTLETDPLQLCFGTGLRIKVLASMLYGITFSNGALALVSFLTLCMSYVEGLITYSNTVRVPIGKVSRFGAYGFRKCYRRLNILKLHMNIGTEMLSVFLIVGVFCGIMFATCTSYIVLKMYGLLSIVTYVLAFCITIIVFQVVIVLTYMMNIVRMNGVSFKPFWKRLMKSSENRKLIQAAPAIYFILGPFGEATAGLGLRICDTIVENTVTILLLS